MDAAGRETPDETRTLTVDGTLPRTVALAYLRWMLMRGPWLAIVVAALLLLGWTVLWSSTVRWGFLFFVALGLVVLVTAIPVVAYRATLRSLRVAYPEGTIIEAHVTNELLRVSSALGASDVRLAAIHTVDVSGKALIVRLSHARGVTYVLPTALFTDSDIRALAGAAVRR